MATVRIPETIWKDTYDHLFGAPGEHFAFFLAEWSSSQDKPVFLVQEVLLISDDLLQAGWDGFELSNEGILLAINTAVKKDLCLIEIHNHGGSLPRFSRTDRQGLQEFPQYVLSSLPGRPYAATVWGDTSIYGEYFLANGKSGAIESLTVVGRQLQQMVSRDDDLEPVSKTFDRQLPWFTDNGQQALGRLKIGVVGCGGTGSHMVQQLAYLGCRDFVVIDHDQVDQSNLNRLVIATPADLGAPKVFVARRYIRSIAPDTQVCALEANLTDAQAIDALRGVDVIFGCVDNDGARLVLNEIASAYNIPYLDLGVGIDATNGTINAAGGRVTVVLPNGPCLICMNEIDRIEAAYFLSSTEDREFQVERGYIDGVNIPAPAVVSINGQIASLAATEFCVLVSGVRSVHPYSDYDLMGIGRQIKSQWITPRAVDRDNSCVHCALAGKGEKADVDRYASKPISTN